MCNCNDPNLPTEANAAKGWCIASLVIGIIGCINFLGGTNGLLGGVGGLLMIVAGAMPICCIKSEKGTGGNAGCIYKGSFACLLLAAILEVVCIAMIGIALSAVNEVDVNGLNKLRDFALTILYIAVGITAIVFVFASIAAYKCLRAFQAIASNGQKA